MRTAPLGQHFYDRYLAARWNAKSCIGFFVICCWLEYTKARQGLPAPLSRRRGYRVDDLVQPRAEQITRSRRLDAASAASAVGVAP